MCMQCDEAMPGTNYAQPLLSSTMHAFGGRGASGVSSGCPTPTRCQTPTRLHPANFSKVLSFSLLMLCSKCARALTFQNLCQATPTRFLSCGQSSPPRSSKASSSSPSRGAPATMSSSPVGLDLNTRNATMSPSLSGGGGGGGAGGSGGRGANPAATYPSGAFACSKVLYIVTLCRKCTKTLIFENFTRTPWHGRGRRNSAFA
jgi:hypothetical protein